MEKQSTTPQKQPKNPWIVLKIKYYKYIAPASQLAAIMDLLSEMEELDDNKIVPMGTAATEMSIAFMSDIEYKRLKANAVLLAEEKA